MKITRAEKEILFDESGKRYIDLTSGNCAAWLGHKNQAISEGIKSQLDKVWITGQLAAPVIEKAAKMIEEFFPPSHYTACIYSTGMEAAEFAIRMARSVTGKPNLIGFSGSMHGKSLATAHLGWDNNEGLELPQILRLPFLPAIDEPTLLGKLDEKLAAGQTSAVFFEPLQGSAGCHLPSTEFCRDVIEICRNHKALSIYDEILTGFYRTGSLFRFSETGLTPDIVLIGKAIGNGFPVSAVVANKRYLTDKKMLPGSTYANNPLAAAAVVSTLSETRKLNLPELVTNIEKIISDQLGEMSDEGIFLRGKGALWMLELPGKITPARVRENLLAKGVIVSCTGRFIRITPPAIISHHNLTKACKQLRKELLGMI